MIVVSDTTAISSLHRIDRLHILKDIFGEVVIPYQVHAELTYFEKLSPDFKWHVVYPWIKAVQVTSDLLLDKLQHVLDEGESAAIALTIQLHADLLLIDERQGRQVATENGIKVIGLIGVLEVAKRRNHIALIKPVLDELMEVAHFRISKSLYDNTLKLANEL